MKEIDFIESMKVLKLEPGDIIVLKTDKYISGDHAQSLRSIFEEHFEEFGNKVLVLTDGMDIGALRKGNDC